VDKKAKKRIDVLHQKLQKLRQQLAGAKQQPDEPGTLPAWKKKLPLPRQSCRR
jgi:hypothetical protein